MKTFIFKNISILLCALFITHAGVAQTESIVNSTIPVTTRTVTQQKTVEGQPAATRLWNLQDADILSVINEVSQETGKNFVVDPRVNGKITLISSKPLKQNEVYQVFLSVLGILGYSAIPAGKVIKIVPNTDSGEQNLPVLTKGGNKVKGEEVIVRVIPLENISATQLIPILRPLLPQWSNISAYTPGNVLILLGRASNLNLIMNIIQDVDHAANAGIEIIPLKYASATQVGAVLANLQTASRAAGEAPGVAIAVDERSNSILISGLNAARLRLRVLIARMDAPVSAAFGNTEVVYLRYLQAKDFAPRLGKIAQNILGKDTGSTNTTQINLSGTNTSVSASKESANATNIQAEPSTNALIITAPPALMQSLKSVIAKLDIRPAQVLVEAIIAQVDENNFRNLGIQWGNLVPGTDAALLGGAGGFPPLGSGVVGIIPGVHIQAVLSILQRLVGVDILSTPSVMVLDNQPAVIEIGQDIPVTTGQYATNTQPSPGTVNPFTTQSYKQVTLKLDVTPQINLGRSVRLKIKLKNDTVAGAANASGNPPINTSNISNQVIVNHEDVLVLGGLMSNTNNETITKVPILGDVPVIGKVLFTQKDNTLLKKNLMVFIKTTIVNNADEANYLSHNKYTGFKQKQMNHRETLANLDPNKNLNKLPPWQNPKELPVPFEKEAR